MTKGFSGEGSWEQGCNLLGKIFGSTIMSKTDDDLCTWQMVKHLATGGFHDPFLLV